MRADRSTGQPFLSGFGPIGAVEPRLAAASKILVGDALQQLRTLPPNFAQTCITSPPYWGLRDYDVSRASQIGAENDPDQYLGRLVAVFSEVRRVLREDGTLWLNLPDRPREGDRFDRVRDNVGQS